MSEVDRFPDLAERLQAIRERIRRRLELTPPAPPEPHQTAPTLPELSLLPLQSLQARPAATESLAAAVGQLNPRAPGLANELIQSLKRTQARISDWQLRPQREFNLSVVESLAGIDEALETWKEALDRNFTEIREAVRQRDEWRESVRREIAALCEHLNQWRQSVGHEIDALCEHVNRQRWAYEGALKRQTDLLEQLQKRVAAQAKAQATRIEGVAAAPAVEASTRAALPVAVDYFQLEHQFRGTEEEVRKRQSIYLPIFRGRKNVLDLACGRGEFLDLMREAGVETRGVDLDADMVGRCLEKKLSVVQADVFSFLAGIPDGTLDGIFSSQFVEHLEPGVYLGLISTCFDKLAPGGVLAFETQNPECLAIFSQSFFLDPTHVRPIPPAQLRFAFAEAGFERVGTYSLSPAAETLPLVPTLPPGLGNSSDVQAYNAAVTRFNEKFFGGMDYAVIGYRPAA
jgi:2-polyprenyl-3-methyl-5-hydroxy-6-metoxy-1,4-benzoquinol methylase